MLTHDILRNDAGFIIKTTQSLMSFHDTQRTYIYKGFSYITRKWVEITPCVNYCEDDEKALKMLKVDPTKLKDTNPHDKVVLIDYHLVKLHKDNYILFTYNGYDVWYGFNDMVLNGYFFVRDEAGNDLGVTSPDIAYMMKLIDKEIK